MKKRVFTNIYNPLYTGIDRFLICQGRLYLTEEEVQANLRPDSRGSTGILLPIIAHIDIDETLYIQEKTENESEDFHIRFLNLAYQHHRDNPRFPESYSATQTLLYDCYEDAVNIANKILGSNYHRGFESGVYGRIGVPVYIPKIAKKDYPFIDKSETIVIKNAMLEETFFERNS